MKYSREQELQADAIGLRYLAQAGYDPHAARPPSASPRKPQQSPIAGGPTYSSIIGRYPVRRSVNSIAPV
jgi:Peptidase family M48